MLERFRRAGHDPGHNDAGAVATAERDRTHGEHDQHDRRFERDAGNGSARTEVLDRERHDTRRDLHRDTAHDVRLRQRDEYGGFNIGAAFFGWLVAIGMAALLTAILSAAGTAIGLTEGVSSGDADTIGIVGGILFLAVLLLAYYCGGYVAGRMSRFDGARQGLGVWLFGLLATIAIGVAGAILGSEYNILGELNLPRIPIDEGDLTTGGIIALAAILLGTLLAAMLGGKAGERYHRKIDRYGFREHERAVTH